MPDILAFGIFAHDDQVDAWVARVHAGQVLDGPEVGEQLELLAQVHVDAGKAAADGRGDRPFQRQAVRSMESISSLGMYSPDISRRPRRRRRMVPSQTSHPIRDGRFENADGGIRDFRADAVAGISVTVCVLSAMCFSWAIIVCRSWLLRLVLSSCSSSALNSRTSLKSR